MASASSSEPSTTPTRILCVDDEPRVLDGLENHLAMDYDVHLAASGLEGLRLLQSEGPFAVVVSDMRMPIMDGATFLARVRQGWPDTTRLLLTGHADLESAVAAVNKGNIFRFLHKPCPPADLLATVRDAVRQHQLVLGERELLQNTLNGAVSVLTDVLSLTMPAAFARVAALEGYVLHCCSKLGVEDTWQYELATALCQLGCITLPPSTLDKLHAGQELDAHEAEMLEEHPAIGQRLLAKIPRLELVARMIGQQRTPAPWSGKLPENDDETVALGSNLLAVALAIDEQVLAGHNPHVAVQAVQRSKVGSIAQLAALLENFAQSAEGERVQALQLAELRGLMTLDEDVVSKAGGVLVRKGTRLNGPLLERLHNFARGVGVVEPIRVRVAGRSQAATAAS
jgi:response regulator RpfG family c-di-GMP phosphodiesterase